MINTEEKSLLVIESNNINFLIKIKNFLTHLFSKQDVLAETIEVKDELASSFENTYGNKTIEQIQVLFENGQIKESELPSEKLEELKSLYVSQLIQIDEDSIKYKN